MSAVKSLDSRKFIMDWMSNDYQDGDGCRVFGQVLYSANGIKLGNEFQVNTFKENPYK